jgi:hypothetical protein
MSPLTVLTAIGWVIGMLFRGAQIYFVSRGQYWALLIYAALLGVRTLAVILVVLAARQHSEGQELVSEISLMCDYIAMYWLFTEPGRRWFKR